MILHSPALEVLLGPPVVVWAGVEVECSGKMTKKWERGESVVERVIGMAGRLEKVGRWESEVVEMIGAETGWIEVFVQEAF